MSRPTDFNNDGVFTKVKVATYKRDYSCWWLYLIFNANPNTSGGQVDKLGMRSTATNKGDIEQPIILPFSGEVEDMLLYQIYPPKGEKQTTDGFTGETVNCCPHFTWATDRLWRQYQWCREQPSASGFGQARQVLTAVDGNYIRPEGTHRLTVIGNDVRVKPHLNADLQLLMELIFAGLTKQWHLDWLDLWRMLWPH